MEDKTKEVIRMELYKEAYLQWLPEIKNFTGNIAKAEAKRAVDAFDEQFNSDT